MTFLMKVFLPLSTNISPKKSPGFQAGLTGSLATANPTRSATRANVTVFWGYSMWLRLSRGPGVGPTIYAEAGKE